MNVVVSIAIALLFACALSVFGVCVRLQLRWRAWLRNVPGPQATSFCYGNLYELICRDVVPVFLEWKATYGDVVRIWGTFGEPRLVLTDPVAIDYVLRKRAYAYPKVRIVRRMLGKVMGYGLLAVEGDVHRRQKRAIQPGFSTRSIRKLTPLFQRYAHGLRVQLARQVAEKGALVDLYRFVACAALDAIGSAGFNVEFNTLAQTEIQTDGQVHVGHPLIVAFEHTLEIATGNTMARNLFDAVTMVFPWLERLPIGVESGRFRKAADVLFEVASELVQEAKDAVLGPASSLYRTRSDADRPDLLAALLRANANTNRRDGEKHSVLDKTELSDDELAAQLSTFIFAGHETTATQTTWLLWALAQNPDAQDRLRAELRAARRAHQLDEQSEYGACDERRDLTMDELEALPYLDACVRESLRLHGAIHTTSRMATERDVVPCADGRRILVDKDTVIMIPLAAISQDPELWGADAHCFRPERWFEEMPGKEVYSAYGGISFLLGAHACIGRQFAVAEMKSFVSVLVNALRFVSDGRRTIVKRWIVSRPYDLRTHQDACMLRVCRAP
ncbi:hypothetical protein CBS9595_001088 [Malassezia furfur]|nr:hypothetical protein CBS9595_001088 [Malassezia furfur]